MFTLSVEVDYRRRIDASYAYLRKAFIDRLQAFTMLYPNWKRLI